MDLFAFVTNSEQNLGEIKEQIIVFELDSFFENS